MTHPKLSSIASFKHSRGEPSKQAEEIGAYWNMWELSVSLALK
jgi:hypothetical protein